MRDEGGPANIQQGTLNGEGQTGCTTHMQAYKESIYEQEQQGETSIGQECWKHDELGVSDFLRAT